MILIIEDEELVRENIQELLEAEGFQALSTSHGVRGIQLAQMKKPDLILCDVMMPNFDGYQVLKQLRQNSETAMIPFIFLTAKASKSDLSEGMELGADDYLTKPFTRAELLGVIQTYVARKKLLRH